MTDPQYTNSATTLPYEIFCARIGAMDGGGLLYAADDRGRNVLEVLWLKLSLLADTLNPERVANINPAQCTVHLLETAHHLPRSWNFRVSCMSAAAPLDPHAQLAVLGRLWFRTLLVGPRQTLAQLDAALMAVLNFATTTSAALLEAVAHAPALQIGHLVDRSDLTPAHSFAAEHWQATLTLGLRMITHIAGFSYLPSAQAPPGNVWERVYADIEALRARVGKSLFVDPPAMEKDLRTLLAELIRDPLWLDTVLRPTAPPTIAAATPPAATPPRAPSFSAPMFAFDAEETKSDNNDNNNMESTIIVKRGAALPSSTPSNKPAPPAPTPTPTMQDDLEATLIVPKDKKR